MPNYLALVEVDQRQNFILRVDKLREILGASRLIDQTRNQEANALVKLIWPVSGVLWFTSTDLTALYRTLQEIRHKFHDDGLSATFVIGEYLEDTFTADLHVLELKMRSQKDTKSGEDGSPRCPLFAQCSIQGALPANHWWPHEYRPSRQSRKLISDESNVRLLNAGAYSREVRKQFDQHREYPRQLQDVDDLVLPESDSYTALIKADGDGLGRLLPKIDWERMAAELGCAASTEAAQRFAEALQTAVERARDRAVREVIGQDRNKRTCFPILPLVAAGDDLWILCRRDLAFPLVLALGREFDQATQAEPVLALACRLFQDNQPLTLSFGLLFAKKGFPFDSQLELAEELEREAKKFRRTLPKPHPGCVDYHWLESSGRETIGAARTAGYSVKDDTYDFVLTTRPWTIDQTAGVLNAAREVARIPRCKRHQLDTVLRYGHQLSDLAYTRWCHSLTGPEHRALEAAVAALPAELRPQTGPWFPDRDGKYRSALPDLAELAEIIAS